MKRSMRLFSALMVLMMLFGAAGCAKSDSKLTIGRELGFEVTLPENLEGKFKLHTEEREAGEQKINVLIVVYLGKSGEANILTIEEMSADVWTAMQQEAGPQPTELAVSESGRAVVYYPLQSNPYEPDTDDAAAVDDFHSKMQSVIDSFRFVK